MINYYKLRKWIAYIIMVALPSNAWVIATSTAGFFPGIMVFGFVSVISIVLGNIVLKTPFSDVLEGNGLLVIPLDSTGICHPLIVNMDSKTNKLGKKNTRIGDIEDYFDRETGMSMGAPIISQKITASVEKEGIKITDKSGKEEVTKTLSFDEYSNSRFGLNQFPLLFWNKELGSFLTKSQISDFEKETLSVHPIYRLNVVSGEMQTDVRDLSRGIVDVALKPEKKGMFQNPIVVIVIIILIVVISALMLPKLLPALSGSFKDLIPK